MLCAACVLKKAEVPPSNVAVPLVLLLRLEPFLLEVRLVLDGVARGVSVATSVINSAPVVASSSSSSSCKESKRARDKLSLTLTIDFRVRLRPLSSRGGRLSGLGSGRGETLLCGMIGIDTRRSWGNSDSSIATGVSCANSSSSPREVIGAGVLATVLARLPEGT